MRKTLALKTLLRSPLKSILTLFLIAAASFALFSRVIGYTVTTRETTRAESFYSGVAALDNSMPEINSTMEISDGILVGSGSDEDKPWPADEQIEEFSSLPGVTLVDTRYMTAGLVADYKRLTDDTEGIFRRFVIEGTYIGYEEIEATDDVINLVFDDVKLLAGDIELDLEEPMLISNVVIEDLVFSENPFPLSFFDKLDKGSRCLVMATYYELNGRWMDLDSKWEEQAFRVLDGLGDQYLETETFTFQKGVVDAINQATYTHDIVYTEDMRAIPRFNERNMVITEGRQLMSGDTEGCVVSELFMETYNLALGDKIDIELGDKLFPQNNARGAAARDAETTSNFIDTAELEIIGVYQFTDTYSMRQSERKWCYTPSTIFVPKSLLPVEVPDDHQITRGEFSVFIEDARDIEAFYLKAEPLAQEMDVALRFSDGGWLSIKDSFETGSRTAFLTTVLYLAGAAIALLLAVYLYISNNKKSYAIMRTQGVSAGKASEAVVLPLGVLSMPAILAGGMAGLLHASAMTAETLENMASNTADTVAYVTNSSLPIGVILLCLFCELVFISSITLLFLRKIRRTPLLDLLQGDAVQVHADPKSESDRQEAAPAPATQGIAKAAAVNENPSPGGYGALYQVTAYTLRHMRRGAGKTALSLIMTMVLTAGVGLFVIARLTYQDAFRETIVNGNVTEFSSAAVISLTKSNLLNDFYCHGNFRVRLNGMEHHLLTFTNDLDRYLSKDSTITYAEGYDAAFIEGSDDELCLLGQATAKAYDIRPGEEIALFPEDLYFLFAKTIKDEEKLQAAIDRETVMYKVAGIIESDNESISSGIFAALNNAAEDTYGQPFPIEYSEFTLADNEKIKELNGLLKQQTKYGEEYAPMASFYIDKEGLENIRRVRDLLDLLFPVAVAAAVLIGIIGPGLMIMQLAREAAFLRVLGVTKKRVRCMLALEQIALSVIGIAFVAGGLALYNLELMIRSADTLAICGALYLVGCVLGATGASILVTRRRVLDLLQVKE